MSDKKWIPIPQLENTTFPQTMFTIYMIITFALSPIYWPILILEYGFKNIMYVLNKFFFSGINKTLTPIEAKPENYVVITGAASGIGKEMTLIYASKGFSVILIDINEDGVQKFAQQLKKRYGNQKFPTIVADLSTDTAAQDIFEQITKKSNKNKRQWGLDNVVILVNNAGYGMTGVFLNQNLNNITNMCKVNGLSCIQLGHLFGRYFVSRGRGRICQIASIAAYTPGPLAAAYHGTKAMVRQWGLSFQHELLGTGVSLTVVSPAAVNTNFSNKSHSNLSHVFTTFKFLSYSPKQIATHAVNATLNGKREVFVGPLAKAMHFILGLYGETYNVIAARFLWATPSKQTRSAFERYQYK